MRARFAKKNVKRFFRDWVDAGSVGQENLYRLVKHELLLRRGPELSLSVLRHMQMMLDHWQRLGCKGFYVRILTGLRFFAEFGNALQVILHRVPKSFDNRSYSA
jgi:hypothetical protein